MFINMTTFPNHFAGSSIILCKTSWVWYKASVFARDSLSYPATNARWDALERALLEHYGIPHLSDKPAFSAMERVNHFLLSCGADEFLTAVAVFLSLARQITPDRGRKFGVACLDTSFDSISDSIHGIFQRHNFGYKIIETKDGFSAVPVDSEYQHKEVVAESISLLRRVDFEGPLDEFTKAIGYYSQNDYENAILWANRAFESTMKSVLEKLGFYYDKDDSAKKLIGRLFENELVFPSLECLLTNIREVLGGLPTIRNKIGGHGYWFSPCQCPTELRRASDTSQRHLRCVSRKKIRRRTQKSLALTNAVESAESNRA